MNEIERRRIEYYLEEIENGEKLIGVSTDEEGKQNDTNETFLSYGRNKDESNIAGLNAMVIYDENTKEKITRLNFLKSLGRKLFENQLKYRATLTTQ